MTRLLLFGRLHDIAGWRERQLEAAPATLLALREQLAREDAVLGEALEGPGVHAVVDQTIVRGDASLVGATEVAFLPPMSGG